MTKDTWADCLAKVPSLRIGATIGTAYRSLPGLLRSLASFVVWATVLIFLAEMLLITAIGIWAEDVEEGLWPLLHRYLSLAVSIFVLTPLIIAVHRNIIQGVRPDAGYLARIVSRRVLRFWAIAFGIGMLGLVPQTFDYVIQTIGQEIDLSGVATLVIILVVLFKFIGPVVLSVIGVRLGMILPAIAIGAPDASLRAAWVDLREVYLRVWFVFIGMFIPFGAIYALLNRYNSDPDTNFFVYSALWDIVLVVNSMVAASAMSQVFLACAQKLIRSDLPVESGSGRMWFESNADGK